MNVIITGAGGPLGQSIMKAAKVSSLVSKIVATDSHQMSVGLYGADHSYVLPKASIDTEAYVNSLKKICKTHDIKALLIGSEPEIRILTGYKDAFTEIGAVTIAGEQELINIALDKLTTCEFLESKGLNFPRYADIGDAKGVRALIELVGFPLLIKPRRGSGSQGVYRVFDEEKLAALTGLYPGGAVVQELLLPDDQEYTVGVFTQRNRVSYTMILHRELAAGLTYRATVVENELIKQEAEKVAHAFGAYGPLNIQLRLTERGPVTFEINPRFSSTTSVRAHFGFNEVDMVLRDQVLQQELSPPQTTSGFMMRYWEEHYQTELREFPTVW